MRSPATLTLVTFLTTLAVLAVTTPYAENSENRYQHSKTVMDVVEQQCTKGTGNRYFCDCAIAALNMYLPPEYASIIHVSLGKARVLPIFDLHTDTPGYIKDQLYDETRSCLEKFTDIQTK